MPKHALPRRRLDASTAKGRKYVSSDHDRESGSEDESPRLLPQLPSAVKRPSHPHGKSVDFNGVAEPKWMRTRDSGGVAMKKTSRSGSMRKPHIATSEAPHKLSLLDEQMLILCRSAIERSWSIQQQQQSPPKRAFGPESIYAATQVQRLFRGFKTRRRLAQADGPQYQRAASRIQFALRRVLVVRRVFRRWMNKRYRCATRIQAWYRGCRCRDLLEYERARFVVERVRLLQRRYRGYRFWNLVAALLARRRSNAATQIQRCYRGMAARRRVQTLRQERMRFAQELKSSSELHRGQSRCDGCRPDRWTEESLFTCFMVRFVGLHDFAGAKTLGMEGVVAFPTSARFSFMYSVLLQATGEDLDVSMAFLRRAQVALKLAEDEVIGCEFRFLLPALQLCKDDIAVLLDLAIISQCMEQITRAESFYRLALRQPPRDYAIPGYWHRVDMVDRLLLNYHRFCSVFKSRQVNVLSKVVPIAKRGEQVRVMVSRLNRFIAISPADDANVCRFNTVYLTEEEVLVLLEDKNSSDDDEPTMMKPSKMTHFESSVRRKNSRRESRRTSSRPTQPTAEAVAKLQAQEKRKHIICQLYQSEFRGLEIKLTDLSRLSEPRSKLTITREQAEKLVRELTFVDPQIESGRDTSGECGFLHRVVLVPSTLKTRMLRRQEVQFSHAIVNAQRIFRGFRVRARFRRDKIMQSIHQRQADDLYAKLHRNFMLREKRRLAAIAIQRIYKGFATRELVAKWKAAAINIQRMVRGHRGRKRAIAFREGNLAFYMAERVFQRGVSISGRSMLLIIEKCGLSFRLEAYDMMTCSMYAGFVTHDSTTMLIQYENWSAAQGLCGQDVFLHGIHAIVDSVAFIDRATSHCVMNCRFDDTHQQPSPGFRLVTQMDCIQAINLRNAGTKGREAMILPLPLTGSDTARIVTSLVERLALVPTISMATNELKKKTPGGFILTVMPPPKVHYTFHKTDTVKIETATRAAASIQTPLLRLVAFPVVNGYRGISVGKQQFRKKCARHSLHFTKCRCVLPFVTTPAYVEAIMLALAPPPPPQNHTPW